MKFKQLSLFLENKPAHLKFPCDVLAKAGINMLTLSLADAREYGIMRLIVHDWEIAKTALETAGCVVKVNDVVGIKVSDHPGGLADLLAILEHGGHDIEYLYACAVHHADEASFFFRFSDMDAALVTLQEAGVNMLNPHDLK